MSQIKRLVGETAIYGFSGIIGRFLNYLLVPLHTLSFSTEQFGVVTEMYAFVAFLIILLTYGMETAFFRFDRDDKFVYPTTFSSLFFTSSLFVLLCYFFASPIAEWLKYPNHPEYVLWFGLIVGLDAVSSIPLAKLRKEGKAKRFALVNLSNVFINIGLNLFFLAYCLPAYKNGVHNFWIDTFYNPGIGVGYIFIANLIASSFKFLLLLPTTPRFPYLISLRLLQKMLWYALPLLIAGLAGMANEMIDRIMLKRILWASIGEQKALSQLGIYGACYKLSIIITLFIQAFRYAAEPFFFAQDKTKNAKHVYAKVMTYFVITCTCIFLVVSLFLDLFKYFIPNEAYWEGLQVVPILLMANTFLGIYYNQSIWFKLTNKTIKGAYIALLGAVITIALNYFWIPVFGYVGSAWATLICYMSMSLVSYLWGKRSFPIPYQLGKILGYLGTAVGLFLIGKWLEELSSVSIYFTNTILLLSFVTLITIVEKPWKLKSNPPS